MCKTDYKIGEKVRIRYDLEATPITQWQLVDRIGSIIFDNVLKYRGKEVTIESVHDRHYHIEEDNGSHDWTWEMFEEQEN